MKIEHLTAHGFQPATITAWNRRYGNQLLPLQAQVVTQTRLLHGANVVVFAPTSSGKTFVGEMAAVRHWMQGRKSVFLTPTKSLAEEQYEHLRGIYESLGIRVVIATRERTSDDAAIARGRFDFAVMVYEKMKAFSALAPSVTKSLGLAVIDELQIIGDSERGDVIDLMLSQLAGKESGIQVVGLSAVLGENSRLAHWLNAEIFVWRDRPVELREGIMRVDTGSFRYLEFNSRREDNETLIQNSGDVVSEPENHHVSAVEVLVQSLVERGEQVLVFVPTRHLSRAWAYRFAHQLKSSPARRAMRIVEAQEESHARSALEECLRCGVAFHNADVPHDLRRVIEDAFRNGEIHVLIATSTLAQGVNLSANNIINVPLMATSEGSFAPLSRQKLRNQGGRAGRVGQKVDFGRSILLAEDESDEKRMWGDFILQDVEPLDPAISSESIPRLVLDLIHTHAADDKAKITGGLLRTYSAMILWSARERELQRLVDESIEKLASGGLIAEHSGQFRSTGVGQACAAFGLHVETAFLFARWQREREAVPGDWSELEVLALAAFSMDGEMFPPNISRMELQERGFARIAAEHPELDGMCECVKELIAPEAGLNDAGQAAAKKALLAGDWIGCAPTAQIEQRYRVFSGGIANLGAHFGWLVQGLAAICAALGSSRDRCQFLADIASRLPVGVPQDGAAYARLNAPGLSRGHITALLREGFDTPESLCEATREMLERLIPASLVDPLLRMVSKKQRVEHEQVDLFALGYPREESHAPSATQLMIDRRSPGQVWFRGSELMLKPKSFQLLVSLSRRARKVVSYPDISMEMWPDSQVEQQQVSAHRAKLVDVLGGVCGENEARELIRVIPGQGLILDIDPAQVDLRD